MLIATNNYDVAVLVNLRETLQQVRDASASAPNPLQIAKLVNQAGLSFTTLDDSDFSTLDDNDYSTLTTTTATQFTVHFYTDSAYSDQLFSANSIDNAGQFESNGVNVFFLPTDAELNVSNGVSTTISQPIYYVLVTPSVGDPYRLTYRNCDNMIFADVTVMTSPKRGDFPDCKNINTAIITPGVQQTLVRATNDERNYLVQNYEIYVQLLLYNWQNLSEEQRITFGMRAGNLVRNALYADRGRGGNCTFFDKDLNGTAVSQFKLMPSTDTLRGMMTVRCVSLVPPTAY